MTEKELKSAYAAICSLLSARKMKPAFDQLRKLIAETGQGAYSDQIYDLEQNYRYMLKYTVDGFNDPERQKIYNHLMGSVFELTDLVHENLSGKYSQSFLYIKKRSSENYTITNLNNFLADIEDLQIQIELNQSAGESFTDKENETKLLVESQQKIIRIFYHILFLDKLQDIEKLNITKILDSQYVIPEFKSLLITTITFSLLRYFDEEKFEFLFRLYEKNSDIILIRQRCLTGLIIALFKYDYRILFYPQIIARFGLQNENPEFKRNIERIMLQLISSKETEKIRRRIQDEIIPEMIRISPNIQNKLNFESLMEEGAMDDKNPEWSEIFKDSPGLMEKMEELTKMQMEGADVFLSSFSMLKTFPFFNEFVNWFIPFYPEHPDIRFMTDDASAETEKKIIESLLHSPILCNSDKYSFSLVLHGIPNESKEIMSSVLKAEMEQLSEIEKDENLITPDRKGEIISNQYIQDLYRFFKLHPAKNDFDDVFSWQFDFHNKAGFGNIIDDNPELIRKIAEFYFEKNYFSEALEIFGQNKGPGGEILQKQAYCHQKLGNYEKALETYQKAELFDLNKIWTLKKIALCYRNLKKPNEALKVYQTIDSMEPDNLRTNYALGYCFTEIGHYQDALNCFFKIEYLSSGNKKVWRPIAWCSFLAGKKEQSEKYYTMLISDNPDKYDLMNMGHVQWALGKRKHALEFYKQSIKTGGFSENDFLISFEEDLSHLISQGIKQEEIPIMLDQLRYSLEE